MRIAIYGMGYVGTAVQQFLSSHYDTVPIDPGKGMNPRDQSAPLAVVCVPTPMAHDGSCDTSIVEAVVAAGVHRSYLLKSTVPPGTSQLLMQKYTRSVVFSPEYIGEGKYPVPDGYPDPQDMRRHNFHIFGGHKADTSEWVTVWQRCGGFGPEYLQTDHKTAELTKYAENMFLAAKKVFCSELFLACEAFGVDYNELRELWLKDARVGPSHTMVWPDQLAYGGKCLPKDTSALLHAMKTRGHDPKFFRAVVERNAEFE